MYFSNGVISDYENDNNLLMECIVCKRKLTGRQRKFCSRKCKNEAGNLTFQSYAAQQKRGRQRKINLVKLSGGRCEKCGYGKNFAALEFHHLNPATKSFQLDLRSLSNRKWDAILKEVEKCILLCSNCHSELHNPDCLLEWKNRSPIVQSGLWIIVVFT